MSKEDSFYVSNKALYQEYLKWYATIDVAVSEGIEEPQIPPFIVDAMIRISTRLSYKPNFINYSFKDDMISDAQYDCIRFAKKFKLTYTNGAGVLTPGNPFSYITTICFNAFLRRIDKEKTQKYIKSKIISETDSQDFFDNQKHEDDGQYRNQYVEFLREVGYSEDSVPMSIRRTKKYQKSLPKGPLDEFEAI